MMIIQCKPMLMITSGLSTNFLTNLTVDHTFSSSLRCIHTCHYSTVYLTHISPFRTEVQYLEKEQVIICTEFLRILKQITSLLNIPLYSCHEGIKLWSPISLHFHTWIQIKQQILEISHDFQLSSHKQHIKNNLITGKIKPIMF